MNAEPPPPSAKDFPDPDDAFGGGPGDDSAPFNCLHYEMAFCNYWTRCVDHCCLYWSWNAYFVHTCWNKMGLSLLWVVLLALLFSIFIQQLVAEMA